MSLCWLRDPFRLRPWLQIRGKSSSACHIWSTSWREERGSIASAMFCTGQASQHLQWIYRLKGSQGISRDSRVLAQLAVHCRKKWLASISSGQCPSQTRRSHPWAPSSGTHQLWSLSRNIWSLSHLTAEPSEFLQNRPISSAVLAEVTPLSSSPQRVKSRMDGTTPIVVLCWTLNFVRLPVRLLTKTCMVSTQ